MMKKRIAIVVLILFIFSIIFSATQSQGKMIKEYAGSMICTTYHVSDNTPKGSRATSTGAVATEYHTVAVDMHNPRFPYGTKLYIKGFGYGVVEDCGNFGHRGVSLDLFTPDSDSYKKPCQVWVLRSETKAEIKARKIKALKKRKKIQKKEFKICFNPKLKPNEIITYNNAIKKGKIKMHTYHKECGNWLKITKTKSGKKRIIYTGDLKLAAFYPKTYLKEVKECK